MAEENGGTLTVGQRLTRIEGQISDRFEKVEGRLEKIEDHLDTRITRHKEANDAAMKELAQSIVRDFAKRIDDLEKKDLVDEAAEQALDAARSEARSNKRWVIGSLISLGLLLLGAIGLLFQLLNKV